LFAARDIDKTSFSATALAATAATKIGSAAYSILSSFWGSSKPVEEKRAVQPQAELEPAISVQATLTLEDQRRQILAISVDPFEQYAVMCDNFGRVMLLDVDSNSIVRVWKGYREVQCGWVVASEGLDTASASLRSSIFLVIYTAKRGILEIWPARESVRCAAFNVGHHCRLLTTSSLRGSPSTSCLLLRDSGVIENISIPFSASLSSVASFALLSFKNPQRGTSFKKQRSSGRQKNSGIDQAQHE
jgi:hypothetical protein